MGDGAQHHVTRAPLGSWQNVNEKEERDLKVLAAPARDKCAGFARSPAALGDDGLRDGQTDARTADSPAESCRRDARAFRRASSGERLQQTRGPRRPLHPGRTASPRSAATPRRAGYAAGPALRGGGIYAPCAARPLPGAPGGAPGVRRASRRQCGSGTFRLSLASPERVYERSVPAVADDDAAPAGE